MFLEPHFRGQRSGWIEVICGPMFSGKTEELIRRIKRAKIARQKVIIYKPGSDTRYKEHQVVSHDANELDAIVINKAAEILKIPDDIQVVGVDEAQFFDDPLIDILQQLAIRGVRVIVAGLDLDYLGKPFGPIPGLLAAAEYVTKVHSICQQCGSLATHSYRKVQSEEQVLVGEKDAYEARCRVCYHMGHVLDFAK